MRYLLFAIAIAAVFTIFTTVFAVSANKNQLRLLPKWVWVALCLVVPILGGILYLTLGRPVDGLAGGGPLGSAGRFGYGARTTTIAPDDDPDFLRKLRDRLSRDDDAADASGAAEESDDQPDDSNDKPGGGPVA
jgi:hypothetical protein